MRLNRALSWSDWLELEHVKAVLDVGCNVGHLLQTIDSLKPGLRLAGVEVNREALTAARGSLPTAELHLTGAEALPFGNGEFDRVTCIEVLEHIPGGLRRRAMEEMHRVLKTDGQLLLQVPHAGAFSWLDAGNFRFRFPRVYSRLLGRGLRDDGMNERDEGVLWHHHFSVDELSALANGLFKIQRVHRGGLFLMPLVDIARWPFYRRGIFHGRLFHILGQIAELDLSCDYGNGAYDVRLLLKKVD